MLALALFSGGCDSLISMKLLKDQGIDVVALHFNIGFGGNKDKLAYFQNATAQIDVKLQILDIQRQFFNDVLFKPKYGYGKYFNPCIDCHANMFANAFDYLLQVGADFVVSGEVLGQRPKSQRKEALDQVKKLVRHIGEQSKFDSILSRDGSNPHKPQFLDELLLRPMSAKLLEPSFPEKMGWVDRERLLDVSGRGRTRQLEMIKEYGFKYFEKPGGGCLLTQDSVALKIKDLISHRQMHFEDIEMVKIGRYLVLENGARCVIARNQEENIKLSKPNPNMEHITLLDCVGPLGIVESNASMEDKILAGRIALSYAKTNANQCYQVQIGTQIHSLLPLERIKAQSYLLLA
ncbi:7-cyano-7-deazaguanine synthase [Helicobacter sp. MIT 21-1697]|uniref:7-cyano-7-deazaguanine synthase n=1 Tax=Helicobacter sp. MIT 21-1697 TaxID=2993733 RepID=UPI00224A8ED8|nr:7-cyano-7-deazaguanine synthase [Helicobacter sp. MIT 21-1697]MCX2717095.1 7-cyano-7-deazaguanine synthase [Helicobacter sp. MIT 21-1697]